MSASPTSGSGTAATGPFGLDRDARTRLADRLEQAGPPRPPPGGGAGGGGAGRRPASLVVPEVALARCDGVMWLTLAAAVAPDDTTEDRLAALDRRLGELRAVPLPLLDPAPAERARVAGAMPPQ